MNIYLILSTTLVGLACFILGMIVESFLESETRRKQQSRIDKLTMEVTAAREKPEIIEIVDRRTPNQEIKFGGF